MKWQTTECKSKLCEIKMYWHAVGVVGRPTADNSTAGSTGRSCDERLSVDDLKGISADFAAICGRVSEHPILVLPSVFPIDE